MNLRLIRIQFIVGKNAVHAGFRLVNNGCSENLLLAASTFHATETATV